MKLLLTSKRLFTKRLPQSFDQANFIHLLEKEGFSKSQASSIMNCLEDAVSETLNELSESLLSKSENDQTIHAYKIDFAHLKSEIHLLEKNDFAALKEENEKVQLELEKLKHKITENINHVQNGIKLEMNFEKSRSSDDQGVLMKRIQENEMKLDKEIQNMKRRMDEVKWGTINAISAAICAFGVSVIIFNLIKDIWLGKDETKLNKIFFLPFFFFPA